MHLSVKAEHFMVSNFKVNVKCDNFVLVLNALVLSKHFLIQTYRNMKVILGSCSKWRRQLAKQYLNIDMELMPAGIDEREAAKSANPNDVSDHPMVIAKAKLAHLLQKVKEQNTLIMCFDTIVCCNGKILEKPRDQKECIEMIKTWAKKDTIIEVYTAVAIGLTKPRIERYECQRADIRMTRDLMEDEISEYIKKSNCIVSSGAVVVEDLIDVNAATVDGDQTIIEGLPIEACKRIIKEIEELTKP